MEDIKDGKEEVLDEVVRWKKHLAHHVFNKHKEKESMQCNFKSDDIRL